MKTLRLKLEKYGNVWERNFKEREREEKMQTLLKKERKIASFQS